MLFSRLPSLSAASQREERRLLGGLRMRTSAAVVLVALLSATLGGYPVGDGGWVPCMAEAAPVAPRDGWHFHPSAGIANPMMARAASRGLAMASWVMWPSRVAHAASCLRFDPDTGSITRLGEEDIEEGALPKVITPVKHPGRPIPVPKEKTLMPGQWHSWTAIGPILDDEYKAARPNMTEAAQAANPPTPSASSGSLEHRSSSPREPDRPGWRDGRRYNPEPALTVLFERYGGVDNALLVLVKATAEDGKDPVMWSDLGNAYRIKGETDLAINAFETAIRLRPHPDFYLNLGGVRFVLGETEEAVRLFTMGLQLNPRHVLLQYSLGNALQGMGRKEDAARAFESTLRIQPDFHVADQLLKKLKREIRKDKAPPWNYIFGTGAVLLVIIQIAQTMLARAVMRNAAAMKQMNAHANGHNGHEHGHRSNGFPKHRKKGRH